MAVSVEELCKLRKLEIAALAAGAGLDRSRTEAIIQGRWTPSPAERGKIAGVLGVAVDDIAWGHKTPIQHLYGHGPG
jgi:transcriptional regulator with XRE-family HTH domain